MPKKKVIVKEKELDSFIGKLVKIVYRDFDKVRSIHGDIVSLSQDFIHVRTLRNNIAISRKHVIKVVEGERVGKED